MLEKKTTVTRIHTHPSGHTTITERVDVYEDGVFIGAIAENNRVIKAEQPANDWSVGTYAQGSLVMHNGIRYLATVEATEEPGTGLQWEVIPTLSKGERLIEAIKIATEYATRESLKAGEYQSTEETALVNMYPKWRVGDSVKVGDIRVHTTIPYECIQAHTTQSTWQPAVTPALWSVVTLGDAVADFVQPTGAHDAYQTGDQVMFEGQVYESLIDANVWSPTDYPAGWTAI